MSGWTMFILPLKFVGLPKNMNSLPVFSFSDTHFIPLKKTASISPLLSAIVTLSLFPPMTSVRMTAALICTYAMSGRISDMGVMLLRST